LRSRRSVMREPASERQSLTVTAQRYGRTRLAPIPDVDTLGDLNARTEQIEVAQDARPIGHRPTLVSFDFDHEASLL
ncbi:hypothetical protein, partial [Streptomyces sp. NPDC091278]|uniref:hypothetical protein n=1 Tax=Streptomyces sp. NPDC091278 TaxID=3155301 RepID=UPI00344DD4D1